MDKDKTVGEYMASIALECEETEEEFIFSHLVKFCSDVYRKDVEIRISKRLLTRALTCFKEEHKEEFEVLTQHINAVDWLEINEGGTK